MKKILSFIVFFFITISIWNAYWWAQYWNLYIDWKEVLKWNNIINIEAWFSKKSWIIYKYGISKDWTYENTKFYKFLNWKNFWPYKNREDVEIYSDIIWTNYSYNQNETIKYKSWENNLKPIEKCRKETDEEMKKRLSSQDNLCELLWNCDKKNDKKKDICTTENQYYIKINWKSFWPYSDYINNSYVLENNNFMFFYKKDKRDYVNINWKDYWYDKIDEYNRWLLWDKFYFVYEKENKKFINIDNKVFWPYEEISDIVNNDSKISYTYNNNKKIYKYFNWKIFWPYDCEYITNFKYENWDYSFKCDEKIIFNWNKIEPILNNEKQEFKLNINWKEIYSIQKKYYGIGDCIYYKNKWLICSIMSSSFWDSDVFIFNNKMLNFKNNIVKEVKKQIKPIPKIDRILNKFFGKIDKKWDIKAQIIYKKILKKIDSIIIKIKNPKKKKILEYLKLKFEEKIK